MLKTYTLDNCEEWDKIVRSFYDYDVYWLSGYVKGFMLHGDGEPLLFHYEDELTRGINVVMKRDISDIPFFHDKLPNNSYFDFSTPYGYGGWLIEGNDTETLFYEYENWCKIHNVISEFVRFHPVIKNHKFCENSYDVVELGEVVTMDISTPEVIWANLTSKNRNMIRKAKKNGVEIYNGRYPEVFEKFKEIYDKTMDKDEAEKYYYFENIYYDSVLNDLPQNAEVFFAELDGKTISSSIMIYANGKMNYHLSGSKREYASLAPTNLLLYEAALWGCSNGFNTLYLGGGVGSGEDNLFKFKRAFYRNDNLNHFFIGKKTFISEEYEMLLRLRNINHNSFFPEYRTQI